MPFYFFRSSSRFVPEIKKATNDQNRTVFYMKRTTFFGLPDDGSNNAEHEVLFQ